MRVNLQVSPSLMRNYKLIQKPRTIPSEPNVRDEVIVSAEAYKFSRVMAKVQTRSPEEQAHIARITNAVRQGQYRIDSDKIADKILERLFSN
ncbi:MAG: flagellar biosynthesis anti-sigma factor FlgM [Oscillospiraceae bacterium]|nr:flagellar biosynthesis anti-sigma factor FlgM [Oscillospiraceae bacterium]